MNKKLVALMLCVAIIASAMTAGTIAWFTASDREVNTFTVGNVSIDLTEPEWKKTGEEEAKEVYPGEALAKDPTVTNKGSNPCFVRIQVENLNQFGNKGTITYRTDYVDGKLGDKWVLNEADGFFYYTEPLAAGATTDALFDQIVMPTGITNSMEAQDIVVTAYAVQAQGAKPSWSAVQTMTVAEIDAWFTTCGFDF